MLAALTETETEIEPIGEVTPYVDPLALGPPPAGEPLIDPFAHAVHSPIAVVRIPARREREYYAFRILGRLAWADGTVRPGDAAHRERARRWLREATAR
jgi:hypothetical protein